MWYFESSGGCMGSKDQIDNSEKTFQPLIIMGIFWLVFGIVVLLATFFVQGNDLIPTVRGKVTNIIAGLLLLTAGGISFLKGRANKQKKV
jgi:hypothetical protein